MWELSQLSQLRSPEFSEEIDRGLLKIMVYLWVAEITIYWGHGCFYKIHKGE